jgi:hypoxanthine-DNA glycosylase
VAGAIPELKSSFPPVVDAGVRVLVLGSLPGEVSLAKQQYYAYPHNQFWRLIAHVLGRELPAAYEARLAALLQANVGLWDVVRTATRAGSLDASIRDHQPNRLADIVATLPRLRAVAFNGATASLIGRRALGDVSGVELVSLPSSSPAYTMAFERKAQAWDVLRRFLES